MVLLEFIDFQVLVLVAQHEQVLSDLIRIEHYWILKQGRARTCIVLTGHILIIQVQYFHSLWVNTVEEDFVEEDFIDWEIFHLDLK